VAPSGVAATKAPTLTVDARRVSIAARMSTPRSSSPAPLLLEVEHGLVTQFRVEAARRDMPVKHLLHDLPDTIAADKLTSAILDDKTDRA
jgi:hypothetical protein